MTFGLDRSRELLSRTPAVIDALLRGLPDAWTGVDEGPDTWTPLDVIAHLAYCKQTNWIPRVEALLAHGADQEFPSFDRYGHFERYRDVRLSDLLDVLASLRAQSLAEREL
jgi:hypothetical protein